MATIDRLQEIVAPLCDELSLELVDLEFAGGVVRVTVDKPDGVDLDTVALVTREISRALDHHDPIAGRYTLEVGSPGLERPLRTPAHFARAVGSTVRLKTRPHIEGDRRVEGVLVEAGDDGVLVRTADGDDRRVPYDGIDKARTVFEWGPTPKPGSARKGAKAGGSGKKAVKA